MSRLTTLQNKSVLITGAASGIGLACAVAYARRGAHLILTDINEQALAAAQTQLVGLGAQCKTLVCDVADHASVAACAEQVHAQVGALDVLVNNAGIYYLGGFMETPVDMFQRMHQVNVMGIVQPSKAFLPAMRAAPGARRIINIASLAAFLPAPNLSAYAMSKHAVLGVSEVMAMELLGSNVGVTVVCPGIINTPLLGNPKAAAANITARQLAMQKQYYARHGCTPDVVGERVTDTTLRDEAIVFVGPKAWLGSTAARVSRRFARWFSVKSAADNGYADPG